MDSLAVLPEVRELGVAEDEGVVFLSRVPHSVQARNRVDQLVDLLEVDLDDREAGWPLAEVLEVAVDLADHCPQALGHVLGQMRLPT